MTENDDTWKPVDFDFMVSGEFLKVKLWEHLKERFISLEDAIQVEYVQRFPSPEPQDCLLHDDWVSAVAMNDKWILTGCYDSNVYLWTNKGQHVLTLNGHQAPVKAVRWLSLTNDIGAFISCSQDQTVLIWNWNISKNTYEILVTCRGHERSVDCIDVNSKGNRLASGSWDTLLKIWSTNLDDIGDSNQSKKPKLDGAVNRV